MEGQTGQSLEGKEWFNGSALNDAKDAYNAATDYSSVSGRDGIASEYRNEYIDGIIQGYSDLDEKDIPGIINRTEENIKALAKAEEELNAIPESERDDA